MGNLVLGQAQKDKPVPSLSFGSQSLSKTTQDSLGLSEKVKPDPWQASPIFKEILKKIVKAKPGIDPGIDHLKVLSPSYP